MKRVDLIPRSPRRMLQPPKDEIRRRLEVAQAKAAFDATPHWWRLWHRIWVRIVEVDRIADASPPHRNPPPPKQEPGELL